MKIFNRAERHTLFALYGSNKLVNLIAMHQTNIKLTHCQYYLQLQLINISSQLTVALKEGNYRTRKFFN